MGTEGNVLEACFGLPASSAIIRNGKSNRTGTHVRHIKTIIADAAASSEGFPKLTVGTYLKAFEIVISTHEQRDQLNCITRCFYTRGLNKKAMNELKLTFGRLQETIQASS